MLLYFIDTGIRSCVESIDKSKSYERIISKQDSIIILKEQTIRMQDTIINKQSELINGMIFNKYELKK